jgi:hypothetical protein
VKIVVIPIAEKKIERRNIPMEWVKETVRSPEQTVSGYGGRTVYQKRYETSGGKQQLLRVVTEKVPEQIDVITAYLTSEINRYWRV